MEARFRDAANGVPERLPVFFALPNVGTLEKRGLQSLGAIEDAIQSQLVHFHRCGVGGSGTLAQLAISVHAQRASTIRSSISNPAFRSKLATESLLRRVASYSTRMVCSF